MPDAAFVESVNRSATSNFLGIPLPSQSQFPNIRTLRRRGGGDRVTSCPITGYGADAAVATGDRRHPSAGGVGQTATTQTFFYRARRR